MMKFRQILRCLGKPVRALTAQACAGSGGRGMEPEVEGWIAPHLPKSKRSGTIQPALRCIVPMRRCACLDRYVSFLRQALDFTKSGGATGGFAAASCERCDERSIRQRRYSRRADFRRHRCCDPPPDGGAGCAGTGGRAPARRRPRRGRTGGPDPGVRGRPRTACRRTRRLAGAIEAARALQPRDRRAARCRDWHHPRCAGGGGDAMNHVNVTINGRQYRMACEEGQEARLLRLAETLETRIESLRGKFGEIGDARLTVMAALTVCDELSDAGNRIRALEQELRTIAADRAKATQIAVANALNAAADRIEKTTQVLNRTVGNGVAIG